MYIYTYVYLCCVHACVFCSLLILDCGGTSRGTSEMRGQPGSSSYGNYPGGSSCSTILEKGRNNKFGMLFGTEFQSDSVSNPLGTPLIESHCVLQL